MLKVNQASATNIVRLIILSYSELHTDADIPLFENALPVTLQLNVKNLFDKSYYTSSIATNNLGNQPGDPREVQFTV
jgi:iron complex outermembrane receptor protein